MGGGIRSRERDFRQDWLQVWSVEGWIALPEERGLPAAVPEGERCFIFPYAWGDDVSRKLRPTPGRGWTTTIPARFALIADPRLDRYLGRVDCTEAKHDLAASDNPVRLTVPKKFDRYRSFAGECDAYHERAAEHREIVPVHIGISICTKQRQAATVVNSNICDGSPAITFHHFTILVIESRNPKGSGRLQHGWSYWVGVAGRFYMDEATLATSPWIWRSLPVLKPTVQGED